MTGTIIGRLIPWSLQRRLRKGCPARTTPRARLRPCLEVLEDRLTPSAYTVNSAADTGAGSGSNGDLRYCITQANSNGGTNTIQFDPTVFGTPQTITLTSLLPAVTDNNLTIAGPGASLATISGNHLFQDLNISAANASLSGLTIANASGGTGGGIYFGGSGTLAVSNTVISNNYAGGGAGIYLHSGNLALGNSVISNNSGNGAGAGILIDVTAAATLTNCTLCGNSVSGGTLHGTGNRGGAIYDLGSSLTLTSCTLSNNFAYAYGGAIWNTGTAILTDCTMSGNSVSMASSAGNGGAIIAGAATTLTNCTVSGNSAQRGGGVIISGGGTLTLNNTLIAGNTASVSGPDVSGTVNSSSGYNLIGNGTGMTGITNGTNGNQIGTSQSPINPRLAALGNYGGPTQTMALLPGSPALDAGSNALDGGATTDQRGDARIVNGTVDIGAFESQAGPAFSISAPASTTAGNAFSITVSALDGLGQVNPNYTGTITLGSTDPLAVLPATYTFTSADQGVHTFTVTLKRAGAQTIAAVDALAGSASVTVAPAAASQFVISGPSSVSSGTAFSLTVTAMDAYGNVATGYTGTVHFSSSDRSAGLPANYTFTASDSGTHTFSNVKLKTKGTQQITVTDTLFSSITGSWTTNVT